MTTQKLGLTDVSATGAGCACCATPHDAAPATVATGGVVATYAVAGMTCGHCVGAVTTELGALDGVQAVDVTLVAGGTSRVTVTSTGAPDDDAVRAAVAEAGYDLAGRLS